jgi:hypothetical protein
MEQIKQQYLSFKPNAKESSINSYCRHLEMLKNKMDCDNYDYIQEPDKVLEFLHNMKNKVGNPISYTTIRNYLNPIVVLLQARQPVNKELLEKYMKVRDKYNHQYIHEQETSKISDKQAPNFATPEEINDMILKMKKDINDKELFTKQNLNNQEDNLLKAYIMFSFLIKFPIRNELAGIKLIGKREYNKLSDNDKKLDNYIVNSRPNYILSLGDYKTNKHHGVKMIIIDKENESLLKKWIKMKNIQKGEVIFPISRVDLSNLLINYSTKYIGKRISTTMIRKARASVNVESKKDIQNLADIMTHKIGTHMGTYTKEN